MSGDVVTVTSGKGGVGKTTTAVNLAVGLRQRGHPVVVVDADLGMPNVARFFDLEAEGSVHDVLADGADDAGPADEHVEDALVELAEGLAVLPGDESLEGFAGADPAALEGVVGTLAERYRYVLVDTGGGLTYEGLLPLELGDETVLVSSPDPAAVGDTTKSRELAERLDVPVRGVVVTHATGDTDPEAVADEIGVDLLGAVPLEPAVHDSTAEGVPVAAYAPDSGAAKAYDSIAAAMADDAEATLDPLDSKARKPDDVDGQTGEDDDAAAGSGAADADGAPGDGSPDSEPAQATDGGPEATGGDDGETATADGEDREAGADSDGASSAETAGSGGFFSRLAGIFG